MAEQLPWDHNAFDLVASYLSLIDIPDIEAAIAEMARVLNPGGTLLIANLNSFSTAASGWVKADRGEISTSQSTTIFSNALSGSKFGESAW